ncbi:hypothetical protein KA071_02390, partial [Candidatus Gracilibacteria bacterium]|nr:hypothetical protein [Candidatus Gracilibacteria bacterium]
MNLIELSKEQEALESQIAISENSDFENPEMFKDYCFYMLEHFKELLSIRQNHEELRAVFGFIFKEFPTYKDVVNRTPAVYPIFVLVSQQKNSQEGILEENLYWQ